jgi:hypothetical protein
MPKAPTNKPRKKRLSPRQRRALELLASLPNGATEATLLAHRISQRVLAGLVHAGLATVASNTVRAGHQIIRIERYRIAEAGRKAIEGYP